MTTWRRHWRSIVLAVCGLALCLIGAGYTDAIARTMSAFHAPLLLSRHSSVREPAAAGSPIKHIVFMIEENRSFDNVFGRFPGADGATTATVSVGGVTTTTSLVPEPYYLWHDIGHDWHDAQISINGGKMDGFSHISYADLNGDKAAYQQLLPGDIPNLYAYARAFTLSDQTFASVGASTFPNHLYTVAAQDGGVVGNPQTPNNAWGCDSPPGSVVRLGPDTTHLTTTFPCFSYATLADRLTQARISWSYYAAPSSDLGYIWSTLDAFKQIRKTGQWTQHVKDEGSFEADARAGRLPAFSWVTPRAATSMHPPAPVCPAENWIVSKLNALMSGPDWANTMVVLTWDDWGGYYDHVAPPQQSGRTYGIRVPLLIISPYARRGYVSHTTYTFESVLRTAEVLWKLAPLTDEDRKAHDLLDSLNLSQKPLPPLRLTPRSCPPAPDTARYHTLLDQALQSVLVRQLNMPMTEIESLHRTLTLAQIAQSRHVDLATLTAALKEVAGAWAGGGVMLQLVLPAEVPHTAYLAQESIDLMLQAEPGAPIFPLHIVDN